MNTQKANPKKNCCAMAGESEPCPECSAAISPGDIFVIKECPACGAKL